MLTYSQAKATGADLFWGQIRPEFKLSLPEAHVNSDFKLIRPRKPLLQLEPSLQIENSISQVILSLSKPFLKQESKKLIKINKSMASQGIVTVNPLQPPVVDVEHTPLADKDFKISATVTDFNLLDIHCWSHDKSIDQADDIYLGNEIFLNTSSHRHSSFLISSDSAKSIICPIKEP